MAFCMHEPAGDKTVHVQPVRRPVDAAADRIHPGESATSSSAPVMYPGARQHKNPCEKVGTALVRVCGRDC